MWQIFLIAFFTFVGSHPCDEFAASFLIAISCPDYISNFSKIGATSLTPSCHPLARNSSCTGGFFSYNGGSLIPCCPGYFCPEGYTCPVPCSKGATCPQANPPNCTPYYPLSNGSLTNGSLCPGAAYDIPCPAGFYCPNTSSVPIVCPEGSFCMAGSIEPTSCRRWLGDCPQGSIFAQSFRRAVVGVIVGLVILLGVAIFCYLVASSCMHSCCNERWSCCLSKICCLCCFYKKSRFNEKKLYGPMIRFHNMQPLRDGLEFRGQFRAGKLTAIMGASGCGKSSLLKLILGIEYAKDGCSLEYEVKRPDIDPIRVNSLWQLKSHGVCVRYACQFEDDLPKDLTVWEFLCENAGWRCVADTPYEIKQEVEKVIKRFRLTKDQNRLIGELSGGGRKRTAIAAEYLDRPDFFLLDEPTSGLDSSMSFTVLTALRQLTQNGATCIVVLHQPPKLVYELFDDVVILGPGGSLLYCGDRIEGEKYFLQQYQQSPEFLQSPKAIKQFCKHILAHSTSLERTGGWGPEQIDRLKQLAPRIGHSRKSILTAMEKVALDGKDIKQGTTKRHLFLQFGNSADIALEAALPSSGVGEFIDPTRAVPNKGADVDVAYESRCCWYPRIGCGRDFFQQFIYLTWRGMVQLIRGGYRTKLREWGLLMGIAFAMGFMFQHHEIEDIGTSNFMTVMVITLLGTVQSLSLYGDERERWEIRSRPSGMSMLAYFLSKCVVSLFPLVIWPWLYLTVYYNISVPRAKFFEWYFVCFMGLWSIQAIAHFVSILGGGNFVGTLVALVLLMFSGSSPTLANNAGPFFIFMCNISPARYLFEALWWLETEYSTPVLKLGVAQLSFDIYGWKKFNSSDPDAMRHVVDTLESEISINEKECIHALFLIGLVVWILCYFLLLLCGFQSPRSANTGFKCQSRYSKKKRLAPQVDESIEEDDDEEKGVPDLPSSHDIQLDGGPVDRNY